MLAVELVPDGVEVFLGEFIEFGFELVGWPLLDHGYRFSVDRLFVRRFSQMRLFTCEDNNFFKTIDSRKSGSGKISLEFGFWIPSASADPEAVATLRQSIVRNI